MTIKTELPFFERLATLYAQMDAAWKTAAAHYGFVCEGCEENCCETEFYHHTYIEKNYLISAMERLCPSAIQAIETKAKKVREARLRTIPTEEPLRIMCPLNTNGLCQLYEFRPMICRLHGIPHELRKPGFSPMKHEGCKAGTLLFKNTCYHEFDRTPFYTEMAGIEMDYRTATGKQGRLKQTISEMLLTAEMASANVKHRGRMPVGAIKS